MPTTGNDLPFSLPPPSWPVRLAAAGAGAFCAAAIFVTLAHTRSPSVAEPEHEVFTARRVALPLDLPPPLEPPARTMEVGAVGQIRIEIAAQPSSSVHIQVPDLPLLAVEDEPPPARPSVETRFDLTRLPVRSPDTFGEVDTNHVFEHSEVDQPPIVLQRVQPRIGYSDAREVESPRTTMVLVVEADGAVGEVRVIQSSDDVRFDRRMVEAVRYWRFSPAVRKGRKVRCWVQQSIAIHLADASPFSPQ